MSGRLSYSPASCFREIIKVIETAAPHHKSGWWNLNVDSDMGMQKRQAREIYKLARIGLSKLRAAAAKRSKEKR